MAKVAQLTLGYYTVCTAAAVALGIILVTVIEPGQGSPLSGGSVTSCHTPDLKVGASKGKPEETVLCQVCSGVKQGRRPQFQTCSRILQPGGSYWTWRVLFNWLSTSMTVIPELADPLSFCALCFG